jgi:hypothetical protein
MAYDGQPVPTTLTSLPVGKTSDGKSVKVEFGNSAAVVRGRFYYEDGFLGQAQESFTNASDATKETILDIEPAVYTTDQLTAGESPARGDRLYFDAGTGLFTVVPTDNLFAGVVVEGKGSGTTIDFLLAPQGDLNTGSNGLIVANATGADIAANALVAISGANAAGVPTIVLADADNGPATHIVLSAIANGAQGLAYGMAFVTGLNTSGVGTAGDPVYLSNTAGGFAVAAPTAAGDYVQIVGYAVTKHASTGKVLFVPGLTPSTLLNTDVAGVAAGYKVARGVTAVTGTQEVTTGLATVVSIVGMLAEDPSADATIVTAVIPAQTGGDAGKATLKVWKPTAADNSAPTAASAAKNVAWVAVGT